MSVVGYRFSVVCVKVSVLGGDVYFGGLLSSGVSFRVFIFRCSAYIRRLSLYSLFQRSLFVLSRKNLLLKKKKVDARLKYSL